MADTDARTDLREMSRRFAGIPMPRDVQLALDSSRRPRVTHHRGPRFPFPVPNGWFIVARSSDLAPGELTALYYFGRDLVLFRTSSGQPRLLAAHCAHLGANLSVGGRVEGEQIVCPFHGWCYDGGSGRCVDIPYSRTGKIPSRARVRSYPTLERNSFVWAWHHLEGKPPFYDVPEVPELADPEWSDPFVSEYEIETCCQEMAENNHDLAHFKYVHGTAEVPEGEVVIDGIRKHAEGSGLVRDTYGLGLGIVRMPGVFCFLTSTTPLDENAVHVRWAFVTPKSSGPEAPRAAADALVGGVSQDIPIWENKRYLEQPVLLKDEMTIADHREWCRQFYSDPASAID